jgi:hypothetical protein
VAKYHIHKEVNFQEGIYGIQGIGGHKMMECIEGYFFAIMVLPTHAAITRCIGFYFER